MLVIRVAKPSDAQAIIDIYRFFVDESAVSFETNCPSVSEMERRIEDTLRIFPWLVAEDKGKVMGYAYAISHRKRKAYQWSVEVSAYVAEGAREEGIGRKLYEQLLRYLKTQGYKTAYAGITLPNPSSIGFHEKMGFSSIGIYSKVGFKLGKWHDVQWFELELGERVDIPSPPRKFFEL